MGGLSGSAFADVSSDGSTIVGQSNSSNGPEAFRWTAESGMVGLGDLDGGQFFSYALATSSDGSVIVGNSASSSLNNEAFIWTQQNGMQGLGSITGEILGVLPMTLHLMAHTWLVGLRRP